MKNPTSLEIRQKAQRILRRSELPQKRGPIRADWLDGDEVKSTILSKRDGQVFQAIHNAPVFCASPVRISDSVLRLRRNHGLPILREDFTERDGDETLTFGVYYLAEDIQISSIKTEGK